MDAIAAAFAIDILRIVGGRLTLTGRRVGGIWIVVGISLRAITLEIWSFVFEKLGDFDFDIT